MIIIYPQEMRGIWFPTFTKYFSLLYKTLSSMKYNERDIDIVVSAYNRDAIIVAKNEARRQELRNMADSIGVYVTIILEQALNQIPKKKAKKIGKYGYEIPLWGIQCIAA